MRILKEDAIGIIPETETAVVVETEPRGPESAEEIASSSMLLNAISDCAKTIEQYNIMKVNLTDPEMISVIDEISSEETLILGKLQSLLKKVSPNAENIMSGAVEVEQGLTESILNEAPTGKMAKQIAQLVKNGMEFEDAVKKVSSSHNLDADDKEMQFAISTAKDFLGTNKTSGKWNTTITAGKALRQAINNEDYQGILDGIKACYKEMLDKGIIDESDYDNWTENLDFIDIEDEDIEDAIDYELNDLYDACDNLNCWIELNESLTEGRRRGFLKQYKGYSIHDCGSTFVITNKNGTTVHQSPTVAGCEGWIDNEVDNKVSESIDTDLMNAVQDAYGYNKKEAKDYIKTIDDKTKAELIKNFKDNAKRSFLTDSLNEDTTKKHIDLLYSKNGFNGRKPSFGLKVSSIDNVYNDLLYYIEKDGRSTVERTFRVNVTPCKPEDIYKNSMSVSNFLKYYENTYGKQNESLKESKDDLETKVYDFLDNEAEVSDYNQMVEDVSAKFHISRKKAEQFVWNYLSAEEESIPNPM